MFSLIITIISIALVAALALATIYYGGTAFNRGTAEAKASQLINEGQQINAAVALAKADIDREGLTTVVNATHLVSGNYLAQMPANWKLAISTGADQTEDAVTKKSTDKAVYAVRPASDLSTAVIEQISKKAGVPGADTDGTLEDTDFGAATAGALVQVYGVVGSAAGTTNQVVYKL